MGPVSFWGRQASRRSIGILGVLVLLGTLMAQPSLEPERRVYRETTGDQSDLRQWELRVCEEGWLAASEFKGERFENIVADDGNTLAWRAVTDAGEVEARRDGKYLRITGTRDGEAIDKRVKIPSEPWFQSINYSLEAFARGEDNAVKFVTLHPSKFSWIRLRASREKVEEIELNGETVEALWVSLRLSGWRAAFWSADYWFRPEDGLFLRYEGANGPAGTPKTIVENLLGEAD